MNRDDIIRMAGEAGFIAPAMSSSFLRHLERFAALVAAVEREACACIAERAGYRSNGTPAYEHIAEAIRARSST